MPQDTGSIWDTLRRGLALSPELYRGLAVTLFLATLMTASRAAAPVAIQHGIDHGLRSPTGPDLGVVAIVAMIAAAVLLIGTFTGYLMVYRLYKISETALATVRVRGRSGTFTTCRCCTCRRERRGALVSRATGDVDQITTFLQWNGVVLLICTGQVLVTVTVMAAYSWRLTLVVLAVFVPVVMVIRACMRRLAALYVAVRQRAAAMLGAVSESVVGAEVVRAYDMSERTAQRLDRAVDDFRVTSERARAADCRGVLDRRAGGRCRAGRDRGGRRAARGGRRAQHR